MTMISLRKVGAGIYETADGRYRIEHQDGVTNCEHPLCETLHRRFHESDGWLAGWQHVVNYRSWHVWDTVKDDYAVHDEFDSKRKAHEWLADHLADADA